MKHWITQRWTALLGLVTVGLAGLVHPGFLLLTMIFVAMHAEQGISSMIMDYVHSFPVRQLAIKIVFYLLLLTTFFWFSQINEFLPNLFTPEVLDLYISWIDTCLGQLKSILLETSSKFLSKD